MRGLFFIIFIIFGSWLSTFQINDNVHISRAKSTESAHFSNTFQCNSNIYEVVEIAEDIPEDIDDDENELTTKYFALDCVPTCQVFDQKTMTTIRVCNKELKPTQALYILYDCAKDYLS